VRGDPSAKRTRNELQHPLLEGATAAVVGRGTDGPLGIRHRPGKAGSPQQLDVVLCVSNGGIAGADQSETAHRALNAGSLGHSRRHRHESIHVRDQVHGQTRDRPEEAASLLSGNRDHHLADLRV